MSIGQIVEGSYNNLTNKKEELYNERMKICRECKLMKMKGAFGEICNPRLYLNPDTNEVSKTPQEGFYRGCGCVLGSKTRVLRAKCPAKKW
jgi:hypothetical protein